MDPSELLLGKLLKTISKKLWNLKSHTLYNILKPILQYCPNKQKDHFINFYLAPRLMYYLEEFDLTQPHICKEVMASLKQYKQFFSYQMLKDLLNCTVIPEIVMTYRKYEEEGTSKSDLNQWVKRWVKQIGKVVPQYLEQLMKIVVQRVFEAWVRVGGVEISRTKQGVLVLVGLTPTDTVDVVQHMVSKVLNMRLWEKDGKTWNASVVDIGGQIMAVSQFTLYGIMKGNKPDFHLAMEADKARQMFDLFVQKLKKKYNPERIQTGKFQHLMEVGSINNGPVTIQYEKMAEQKKEWKKKPQEKNQTKNGSITESKVEQSL